MTYREFLEAIAQGLMNEDIQEEAVAILEKEEQQKQARRAKSRERNAPIVEAIMDYLGDEPESATEVLNNVFAEDSEITVQRVSAVLRMLYESGELNRNDNGRNKPYTYFVEG